jgi:5S rRNA maturation endonuclease (ribonuclease M5)
MNDSIPVESQSKTAKLIAQLGWNHRPSGDGDNHAVETCPLCQNSGWKFYIAVGGESDGLWKCHRCQEKGNFWQLREKLGIAVNNVESVKDIANSKGQTPLPNLFAMHKRLFDEDMGDVLDYLVAERKFSIEVIERMKLGADEMNGHKWVIYPYLDAAGNPIFYKGRSLPVPGEKKLFRSPAGREAPLYNEAGLVKGEDIFLVEGEADCLSMLSQGFKNVAGIPGAANKKASWIERIERLEPTTIYLIYDSDKPGQEGAKEIAKRIGIDMGMHKIKNIVLPAFTFEDSEGNEKPGKDIGEWFAAGHTVEEFEELREAARPFDVEGVQSVVAVLDELRHDLERPDALAGGKFDSPWPALNAKMGAFQEGDVCGIIAESKVGKSTLAMNWLHYLASQGHGSFLFCNEMKPVRLVRKWVSHVTGTDDTPGKSMVTGKSIDDSLLVAKGMGADLLFGYIPSNNSKDVFATIRQVVKTYGVKVVCFDNLQMLIRNLEHSAQEASRISYDFKSLAMELGIFIPLIIQPHRVPEGQIVSARNAMGSSMIEKAVDSMICLHRSRVAKIKDSEFNGYLETDENFEPQLLVRVDLPRYAPGGVCTLYMDGATSTVRSLNDTDLTSMNKPSISGGIAVEAA